jgi:hypothetical protein
LVLVVSDPKVGSHWVAAVGNRFLVLVVSDPKFVSHWVVAVGNRFLVLIVSEPKFGSHWAVVVVYRLRHSMPVQFTCVRFLMKTVSGRHRL